MDQRTFNPKQPRDGRRHPRKGAGMSNFEQWWRTEGSAIRPHDHEDIEEFARRITNIAWSNGEFVEREACALECEDGASTPEELLCAKLIRARGQS